LERLRWGPGFACRFCGAAGDGWWQMADGLRRCAACRSETSVTAGTIVAGTRTPLVSWFAAIWYVVNQKQGVSALGLQRVSGFGSYQTAWRGFTSCAARW
jgi:transposase-like zinc ribbon protein